MKRSRGVTTSAVVALIGSLASIGFGLLVLISAAINPNLSSGAPVVFASLLYFGFGAAGIVSAIGLLRQRNWARIWFIVYSVLLAAGALLIAVTSLTLMRTGLPVVPEGNPIPAEVLKSVFAVFAVVSVLLVGLGVFWAIYFNRESVRSQFRNENAPEAIAESTQVQGFPRSMTIIAWLCMAMGMLAIPQALVAYPTMMFGVVLRGWSARGFAVILAAVLLSTGTGLLRRRVEAHSFAVGLAGFYLLNVVATYLTPGATGRLERFMLEIQPKLQTSAPMGSMLLLSAAVSLSFIGTLLWFLLTRRSAYLAACAEVQGR